MSGERQRRTTSTRDSNQQQQRVSSLPPSLVPLLREPPSASSLDDDEQRPALPSPNYESSRQVLPSITTSQSRHRGNLRQQALPSFRESQDSAMRPHSTTADSEDDDYDDERHHDLGGRQYRQEATSNLRAAPPIQRQPHQPQPQSTPPAPRRPRSAADIAYLSDLSNVSATSSARGAPPQSRASTSTSSDSEGVSERSSRQPEESRFRRNDEGLTTESRPPGDGQGGRSGGILAGTSQEYASIEAPDADYDSRIGRRPRYPVSSLRGSSRTYTPPVGYGDTSRIRGTRSRDEDEEGVHARSDGEHDYDANRGQVWHPRIQDSGVAPRSPQSHQLSSRYTLSQNPNWSAHPATHPHGRHTSGAIHGSSSTRDRRDDVSPTSDLPPLNVADPPYAQRHRISTSRERAIAPAYSSSAGGRYPDDPQYAYDSRHAQQRASPQLRVTTLQHQQSHGRYSSTPPYTQVYGGPDARSEERGVHERYGYAQTEYPQQASHALEHISPRGSPRPPSSNPPSLRMHHHYQPSLQEHQLAGPTARMQELTLLQRSPRLSTSAPAPGYYSDVERPVAASAYSAEGRYSPYTDNLSAPYPARASELAYTDYQRRHSPTTNLYDLQGRPLRATPSRLYIQQETDPSSTSSPRAAKRARTVSAEGPEIFTESSQPSPLEGRAGPPPPSGESSRGRSSGVTRPGGRGRSNPVSASASRSGTRTPLDPALPPVREHRIAPALPHGHVAGLELSLGVEHGYPGQTRHIEQEIQPRQHIRAHGGHVSAHGGDDTDTSTHRGEDNSPRPLFVIGSASGEAYENRAKPSRPKIDVACDFCRKRKMKCDGRRPSCGNCSKRTEACVYINEVRRRGPGKKKKLVAARPKKTNKAIESGTAPVPGKQTRGKGKAKQDFVEGSSGQVDELDQDQLPPELQGHPGIMPGANTDLFLPSMIQPELSSTQLTNEQSPPFHTQQFAPTFSPPIPFYRSPQGFAPELYPPGQGSPPFVSADVLDPVLTGGRQEGSAAEVPILPDAGTSAMRTASMVSSGPSSSESETRKSGRASQTAKRARTGGRGGEGGEQSRAGPSKVHGQRHDGGMDEKDGGDEPVDDEN